MVLNFLGRDLRPTPGVLYRSAQEVERKGDAGDFCTEMGGTDVEALEGLKVERKAGKGWRGDGRVTGGGARRSWCRSNTSEYSTFLVLCQ